MKPFTKSIIALVVLACACNETHSPAGASGSHGGKDASLDDAGPEDAGRADGGGGDPGDAGNDPRDAGEDAGDVELDAAVADSGSDAGEHAGDAAADGGGIDEAGDDAVIDSAKLEQLCEASPAAFVTYEDEAEMIELLVGKWIDCRDSTGFHPEQDGVWFREDGTWAALFFEDDASVRVGAGVDETGSWSIYYEPDPGPQRPHLSVGGGFIVRPTFMRDPIQLRDADENVFLERYVRMRDVLKVAM